MEKRIIGIDPGVHGGIAVLDASGNVLGLYKMPETPMEVLELLRGYSPYTYLIEDGNDGGVVCYLEKVGGMPGQSGGAMFSFGRGYGHLEMALLALGLKTVTVTPQKWQKPFQLGTSSIMKSSAADKRAHKIRIKETAQRLFPQLGKKITLVTCDALMIAEYGRMCEAG